MLSVTSSEVTLCSPLVNSVPHHIISSYASCTCIKRCIVNYVFFYL